MKKTRRFFAVVVALLATLSFTGVARGETLTYDVAYIIVKDFVPERPTATDAIIQKMFDVEFNYETLPGTGWQEKINLLFAAGQGPDFILQINDFALVQELGNQGLLVPFNEYLDKLPNVRALYPDDEWDFVVKKITNADGNMYMLPTKRERKASMAWIYKKGAFDELGLEFPETVDDFYNACVAYKKAYPNSYPLVTRAKLNNLMYGLGLAYGMDMHWTDWYVNLDSGKLEYVRTQEGYREILKLLHKMYAEGLIDPEFATTNQEQWTQRFAQDVNLISYSWATRASWAQDQVNAVNPNANWSYSTDLIVAKKGDQQTYFAEEPIYTFGPIINANLDQKKIDRLIDILDWQATEEGQLAVGFGAEGVTFNYEDGKPVHIPEIQTVANPDGTKNLLEYGLHYSLVMHPAFNAARNGTVNMELSEAFENKRSYAKLLFNFTVEEETEMIDIETVTKDIYEEYRLKFILGELDPNDDKVWQKYIAALESAGLEKLTAIKEAGFERANK